jgi:hypothetical protein
MGAEGGEEPAAAVVSPTPSRVRLRLLLMLVLEDILVLKAAVVLLVSCVRCCKYIDHGARDKNPCKIPDLC